MSEIKYTDIYLNNLEAYLEGYDLIVNQGGQGSSKTRSILQLLLDIWEKSNKKLRITISSYALPHLRTGVLADIKQIFEEKNDNYMNYWKASDFTLHSPKGNYIELIGIEGNEAKATGPRRDILYVNEANKKIKYEVFELMNARTHKCTFIDFNPSAAFWFHEKIQPNFKHKLIKSNYLHNPYLPERELRNLLSKKDKPGFENWWKVYGEGELGQLEGAILHNWKFGEFDNSLPYGYGMDFGVKHNDALIKCAVDNKNKIIYWHEEICQNGLSTDELYRITESRIARNKLIVADSAATRTIKDLKKKGLNIIPVRKNPIVEDIKKLWEYDIIVTPESKNLANDLNNWIWLDKKGEIPMDEFDDTIDAGRYIAMKFIKKKKTIK